MKVFGTIVLAVFVMGFMLTLGVLMAGVGALNKEASLRSSIEAHERSREASFDTMKKIIAQNSQLPAAARQDLETLLPLIIAGQSGGSVFKSVQSRYPEMTLGLYQSLGRSIEAERHTFLNEQKELFDVKREHDKLLRSAFSGTVCSIFGRKPVEVKVISSSEAQNVIKSGVDDNTDLGLSK